MESDIKEWLGFEIPRAAENFAWFSLSDHLLCSSTVAVEDSKDIYFEHAADIILS